MAGATWLREWAGGRVRAARDREVFVIEQAFAGKRYALTLDVLTERDALAELALFERDPGAYRTKRQAAAADGVGPVCVDDVSVAGFLEYLAERGCTEKYRGDVRYSLAEWAEALAGRDLRRVTGRELRAILSRRWAAGRKHRIAHLKSLCAWLRERDEGATLTLQNDPSLGLRVPASRPEKAKREKGYPLDMVERLYAVLWRQDVRDVVRLRACTGMHPTEIERLAAGLGQVRRVDDRSGTVRFVHKSGNDHTSRSMLPRSLRWSGSSLPVRGSRPAATSRAVAHPWIPWRRSASRWPGSSTPRTARRLGRPKRPRRSSGLMSSAIPSPPGPKRWEAWSTPRDAAPRAS